jgi:spore coat polysaccharide biosynthesis protein SpsF
MKSCPTVLIRCDASPAIGYGHLMRCLALAGQMQSSGQWKVIFAMAEDIGGIDRVRAQGFIVERLRSRSQPHAESDWLSLLVERHQAEILVLDVRNELSRSDLNRIRATGVTIVCIDDLSERRLAANLVFYPPIPQVKQLDWTGFMGQCHSGWEWIMMPPQFAAERAAHPHVTRDRARLMVTMGGSDPAGMTLQAIDALDTLDGDFDTEIVIGSAFMHIAALQQQLNNARRSYQLTVNPPSMATVMARADLALASFGATAYELACLGIPAVHLCLSEDHVQSASALADAGAAINLGLYSEVTPIQLRGQVAQLLGDGQRRQRMGDAARALVDGDGTRRIIKALNSSLEAKHAICN